MYTVICLLIFLNLFTGLDCLFSRVVDMWTDADHVRHSLLSQHHCMSFSDSRSRTSLTKLLQTSRHSFS